MDVIPYWTGHRASEFRTAYRMTVEGFAEHLGVATRTVANWDGDPEIVPTPTLQRTLDTALEQSPLAVRQRLALLLERPGDAIAADGSVRLDEMGQHVGAMRAFRIADLSAGGGPLYRAVLQYLQVHVAPQLLTAGDVGGPEQGIFVAAAGLTEMAGWMAHDAGHDSTARHHFSRSLNLVRVAGDDQVEAHVLASMGHLEDRDGRPAAAARLARAGRDKLARGPRCPDLEARLLSIEARALAALGEGAQCVELLVRAEKALMASPGGELSSWVAPFDAGALAAEAVRCMWHLGDLAQAEKQAATIIALRPTSRPRSRALGQIMLAKSLAQQGSYDHACDVAAEVLDTTHALGSQVVVQQLGDLAQSLAPRASARPIRDLLERLGVETEQRADRFGSWAKEDGIDAVTSGVNA